MKQKKQSNKSIRGLVLELRPDDNQKVLLSKHLDSCRFIYNQYAEKFECIIVYVDKYYPSSQICSKCGKIHPEMKDVTNRTLECECGNNLGRDHNSAINILKFGEYVVYNESYQTLGKELSEYKAFKCLDFRASHKSQTSELQSDL